MAARTPVDYSELLEEGHGAHAEHADGADDAVPDVVPSAHALSAPGPAHRHEDEAAQGEAPPSPTAGGTASNGAKLVAHLHPRAEEREDALLRAQHDIALHLEHLCALQEAQARRVSAGAISLPQLFVEVARAAHASAAQTTTAAAVQSFLAGCYLSFGGFLSLLVAAAAAAPSTTPDPHGASVVSAFAVSVPERLAAAAVFPVGLLLVQVLDAELFTNNTAKMAAGYLAGTVTPMQVAANWAVSLAGNLVGSLFLGLVLCSGTGLLADGAPAAAAARALAVDKTSRALAPTFLGAVGANWLICLAVWMAAAARGLPGKALGIWLPAAASVASGFDLSTANFFFIPAGMLAGADVSVSDVVLRNLVPAACGNTLAGTFLVATLLWFAAGSPLSIRAPMDESWRGQLWLGNTDDDGWEAKSRSGAHPRDAQAG